MDNEKLNRLVECCSVLVSDRSIPPIADIYEYARADAAALARELFPVRAKPLVWELTDAWRAGQYRITQTHGGIWWVTHPDACSFKSGLDTAKAACEAHHQARFLELLA